MILYTLLPVLALYIFVYFLHVNERIFENEFFCERRINLPIAPTTNEQVCVINEIKTTVTLLCEILLVASFFLKYRVCSNGTNYNYVVYLKNYLTKLLRKLKPHVF